VDPLRVFSSFSGAGLLTSLFVANSAADISMDAMLQIFSAPRFIYFFPHWLVNWVINSGFFTYSCTSASLLTVSSVLVPISFSCLPSSSLSCSPRFSTANKSHYLIPTHVSDISSTHHFTLHRAANTLSEGSAATPKCRYQRENRKKSRTPSCISQSRE